MILAGVAGGQRRTTRYHSVHYLLYEAFTYESMYNVVPSGTGWVEKEAKSGRRVTSEPCLERARLRVIPALRVMAGQRLPHPGHVRAHFSPVSGPPLGLTGPCQDRPLGVGVRRHFQHCPPWALTDTGGTTMAEEIGNERTVFGYSPLDGTFSLYIYRCPACGTTGKEGSWCTGHSAPLGTVPDDVCLEIRREPVLVPQADSEQSVSRYSDEAER